MRLELVNELGNSITVEVEKLPVREGVEYLGLTLAGPDSVSENIITRAEAEALLDLLQKTLG